MVLKKSLSSVAIAGAALVLMSSPQAHADALDESPTAVPASTSSASIPDATPFRTTNGSTVENVTFMLRMRGQEGLASEVTRGTTHFLSVDEFARRHGQPTQRIAQLTAYLQGFGLTVTAYPNNLAVNAKGTADQFNRALSVSQEDVKVPGGSGRRAMVSHRPKGVPQLPARIANMVSAILGLDNYASFSSSQTQANPRMVKASLSADGSCPVVGIWKEACRVPSDFGHDYGLDPLYAKGNNGSGQTVGIVTLASVDDGAAQTFWSQYASIKDTGRKVEVKNVDGGAGPVSHLSGSGESDADVQQAGGVAPGANVVVYQAPNNDAGWVDGFLAAATDNAADSVSSSWGYSETMARAGIASNLRSPALLAAYDEIFLEMAAQGQSTFLSSGDFGAYSASGDVGSRDLSVDAPASSPYVTSVGGTTRPWSGAFGSQDSPVTISVTTERAWGWDYLWKPLSDMSGASLKTAAASTFEGSGGGYSVIEDRPVYQRWVSGLGNYSAAQYITGTAPVTVAGMELPSDFTVDASPQITQGTAEGRAEPDLSANADPYSGYLLYEPAATALGGPALQGTGGGTSFVAPQLNGASAVISQALGHRLGLWNPWIYKAALGPDSPFTTLDAQSASNTNLYYTGTPGAVYNPATGLGTPNLAKLANHFR